MRRGQRTGAEPVFVAGRGAPSAHGEARHGRPGSMPKYPRSHPSRCLGEESIEAHVLSGRLFSDPRGVGYIAKCRSTLGTVYVQGKALSLVAGSRRVSKDVLICT